MAETKDEEVARMMNTVQKAMEAVLPVVGAGAVVIVLAEDVPDGGTRFAFGGNVGTPENVLGLLGNFLMQMGPIVDGQESPSRN